MKTFSDNFNSYFGQIYLFNDVFQNWDKSMKACNFISLNMLNEQNIRRAMILSDGGRQKSCYYFM